MPKSLIALHEELDEALCELEELSEGGDLEDQFDAAVRVGDLEAEIALIERLKDEARDEEMAERNRNETV